MKHVLLIITFFFCYTLSAQSERDQKIQKKVENNQSTNSSNSNSNNNSGGVSSPSNWNIKKDLSYQKIEDQENIIDITKTHL